MSNSFPASGVSNNHSYWSASSCSNPPPIGYLGHWKVMVGLSVLVLAGVIVVAYRLLANKKPPVHSQKPQEPTVAQLSTNHNPKKYLYLSVTPKSVNEIADSQRTDKHPEVECVFIKNVFRETAQIYKDTYTLGAAFIEQGEENVEDPIYKIIFEERISKETADRPPPIKLPRSQLVFVDRELCRVGGIISKEIFIEICDLEKLSRMFEGVFKIFSCNQDAHDMCGKAMVKVRELKFFINTNKNIGEHKITNYHQEIIWFKMDLVVAWQYAWTRERKPGPIAADYDGKTYTMTFEEWDQFLIVPLIKKVDSNLHRLADYLIDYSFEKAFQEKLKGYPSDQEVGRHSYVKEQNCKVKINNQTYSFCREVLSREILKLPSLGDEINLNSIFPDLPILPDQVWEMLIDLLLGKPVNFENLHFDVLCNLRKVAHSLDFPKLSYLCEKELIKRAKTKIDSEQLKLIQAISISPEGMYTLELIHAAQAPFKESVALNS